MKKFAFLFLLVLAFTICNSQTLAEKLGYLKTDRLLIVNCDDVGMCHAANMAALEGITTGLITSGTIMVPCPEFSGIVKIFMENPEIDLGVHLTHTAEWKDYRWGSVADSGKVKGLLDPDGFLWRSIEEVYVNSTPVEAYYEAKAQIQKALDSGVEVTHLDSHMGTLQLSPPYVDVYLELASEFNLPVRMASQETLVKFGQSDIRKTFSERGVLFPDYFIYEELENYNEDNIEIFWKEIIKNLKPGITELFIHASIPDEKLKSITSSWQTRNSEYELFTKNQDFKEYLNEEEVILIGYKPIFDLQRK